MFFIFAFTQTLTLDKNASRAFTQMIGISVGSDPAPFFDFIFSLLSEEVNV